VALLSGFEGLANGADRAAVAARRVSAAMAASEGLLTSMKRLQVYVMGSQDMSLAEVDEAVCLLAEAVGPGVEISFDAGVSLMRRDGIRVIAICDGLSRHQADGIGASVSTVAVPSAPEGLPG